MTTAFVWFDGARPSAVHFGDLARRADEGITPDLVAGMSVGARPELAGFADLWLLLSRNEIFHTGQDAPLEPHQHDV
jgi:hypothetical protein